MFYPNDHAAFLGDYSRPILDYNVPKWTDQDKNDLRRSMNYIYTCLKRISKWERDGGYPSSSTGEWCLMKNSLPKWLQPCFLEDFHRRSAAAALTAAPADQDKAALIESLQTWNHGKQLSHYWRRVSTAISTATL